MLQDSCVVLHTLQYLHINRKWRWACTQDYRSMKRSSPHTAPFSLPTTCTTHYEAQARLILPMPAAHPPTHPLHPPVTLGPLTGTASVPASAAAAAVSAPAASAPAASAPAAGWPWDWLGDDEGTAVPPPLVDWLGAEVAVAGSEPMSSTTARVVSAIAFSAYGWCWWSARSAGGRGM